MAEFSEMLMMNMKKIFFLKRIEKSLIVIMVNVPIFQLP